jgi:hypothetical protein
MSLVEQTAPAQVVAKTKSYGNPGWKKGVSGNPNGRPTAARQRFTQSFLTDLASTWQKQGKPCLDKLAKTDPATFVRVCASLIPKEVKLEASSPLSDLSEAELAALVSAAQRAVAQAEQKEQSLQLEHSSQDMPAQDMTADAVTG